MCWLHGVSPTTFVPDSPRNRAPFRTVGSSGSGEGMSDFVKQNLGDLVGCCLFSEVAGDRNALGAMVTLPEPGGRAVNTKRPGLGNLVSGEESTG